MVNQVLPILPICLLRAVKTHLATLNGNPYKRMWNVPDYAASSRVCDTPAALFSGRRAASGENCRKDLVRGPTAHSLLTGLNRFGSLRALQGAIRLCIRWPGLGLVEVVRTL
jgi:hypothetical protein